jgi:anti-sigma B factor antagonist
MDQSQYRLEGDVAIVDVSGEIDVLTSGALRDRLLAVAGKGHDGLVVNLDNVDFIDSTGIGVLIGVWRRVQAGRGTLALAAPSESAESNYRVPVSNTRYAAPRGGPAH